MVNAQSATLATMCATANALLARLVLPAILSNPLALKTPTPSVCHDRRAQLIAVLAIAMANVLLVTAATTFVMDNVLPALVVPLVITHHTLVLDRLILNAHDAAPIAFHAVLLIVAHVLLGIT
jgi:hypothetical protein